MAIRYVAIVVGWLFVLVAVTPVLSVVKPLDVVDLSIDKDIGPRGERVCPDHNVTLRSIYYQAYNGSRTEKFIKIFDEKKCYECLIRLDELEKMRTHGNRMNKGC